MLKKIIFITIAAISVMSCRKDPTDVAPTGQLDNITYPKTLSDLQSFLVPGYSNFRAASLYGFKYLPVILSSDHTFCSTTGGQLLGGKAGFLINDVGVTDNSVAGIYSFLYQGVAYMNTFLDRANYYQNTYGNKSQVDALRGQAYFLRGYYFFMLECLFGEQYIDMTQPEDPNVLGVPLPTAFATGVAETNLPRSSAYKVWSQVISDFKLSAQYLHGISYSPTEQGRVSEWAADGMLGKAYVFTKQYDSAKVYLLKVINSSGKSLMPLSKYRDAFNGNSANEFNEESLFEINVDRQPALPGIVFQPYPTNLQSLTTSVGETFAPTILGSGGQDGNGPGSNNMGNGYCQYFIHDKSLRRFGFTLPVYTLELNPDFVGTTPTAANPQYIMDSASRKHSLDIRTDNTVDPRLFVCGLEPWMDTCYQPYAAAHTPNTPDTVPVGKAYIVSGDRDAYWGWSFKKFATLTNNLSAYGANDASNLYLLRLADVYLLYAEACVTSEPATALEYINKVHRRAYGGSTAFDYSSLTAPTLAASTDVDLANNPLRYERYVELFGEGGWWFDICRWGIGGDEAAYYYYGTADYDPATNSGPNSSFINISNWTGNGTNSKAYHFPIPNVEIQSNPALEGKNNYGY